MSTKLNRRDDIAVELCNFVLKHITTQGYRDNLSKVLRWGMMVGDRALEMQREKQNG